MSGEDLTVSALSSTLPFPATPSHWRSEFIVMVTAVCIIHAGGSCKVDDQRLTGDTVRGLWLAVTLSVCVTDIDAGCVTEYTRDCFLFAVWPVLIALCIARHLISHWKWPQMAADSRLTSL